MNKKLSELRKNYNLFTLDEEQMVSEPLVLFQEWLNQAIKAEITEPNAMSLASVDEKGNPDCRVVLLKEVHKNGLVFFTNYHSTKALQIEKNDKVSLVFLWLEMERQVRLRGVCKKITDQDSDTYFARRPRESQLGAWASPQSSIIPSRDFLVEHFNSTKVKFENQNIPRPKSWGGYCVTPYEIEFWQGRSGRLHDRIKYKRKEDQWEKYRLAP